MCVCVCVSVCVKERERERERGGGGDDVARPGTTIPRPDAMSQVELDVELDVK